MPGILIGPASLTDLTARINRLHDLLLEASKQFAELETALQQVLPQNYKTEKGNLTLAGRRKLAELLAQGHKKADIAAELGISPPAVTKHAQRIEQIPRSLS